MWMRSCAVCKALLKKPRLWDSIRCQCGWEWQAAGEDRGKLYHISPANKKVCLKVKRKTRSPTRLLVLCPVALFSCFLRSGEDKRITSQLIRSIVSFPAIFSSSSSEQF